MDQRNNAPHYDQAQNNLQMNSMQLYEQTSQFASNSGYQPQGYIQQQQQQQQRSGFDLVNSLLGGALTSFQKPQQQAPQQQILQAPPQQYQFNNQQQQQIPNNQQQNLFSPQYGNQHPQQQQYNASMNNQSSMSAQVQSFNMQNSAARQYMQAQQPATPFNLDSFDNNSLHNQQQQLDSFAQQMDVLVQPAQSSAPTPVPQQQQSQHQSASSSGAPQGYAEDVLQLVVEQQRRIVQLEQELDKARSYITKLQDFTKQLESEKAKNKKQSRYWTQQEHQKFLDAIAKYGRKDVKAIANHVGTRNSTQVRTHAQKYYAKLDRDAKRNGKDPGNYDDANGLLLDAGISSGGADHQVQHNSSSQPRQQQQQDSRSSSSESMSLDQHEGNNNNGGM